MVKTSPSTAGGAGSIPGQGTKIPHVARPKKKKVRVTGRSGVERKVQVTIFHKPSIPVHVVWKG